MNILMKNKVMPRTNIIGPQTVKSDLVVQAYKETPAVMPAVIEAAATTIYGS